MTGKFTAGLKAALLVLWIGACCVPAAAAQKLRKLPQRDRIVRLCYRGLLRITGVRLIVKGQPSNLRPLLLVSNHVSYLDIMILGASAPVRFTPKEEIDNWFAIGRICRICDAVFIDRQPDKIGDMKQRLQASLAENNMVSLFPESTTGDGLHLQPFKSGFFSLAEDKIDGREVYVQPAAITYTRIRRLPIDTTQWPYVAWYGDMELVPHLWRLLRLGHIDAEITFLPPVTLSEHGDRKKLAAHCHQAIKEAISAGKRV